MFRLIPDKGDRSLMRRFVGAFFRGRRDGVVYRNTAHQSLMCGPIPEIYKKPSLKPVLMSEDQKAEVYRRTGSKVFVDRMYVEA